MLTNKVNTKKMKSGPRYLHFGYAQSYNIEVDSIPTGGEYFIIELMKPNNQNPDFKYKLVPYFTVNSTGAAPSSELGTLLEIPLGASPTITDVRNAIVTALETNTDIRFANVDDTKVKVRTKWFGECANIIDGSTPTNFTFEIEKKGFGGFMGATQGGIAWTYSEEITDIDSDSGAKISSTKTSAEHGAKTTLLERTLDKIKFIAERTVGEKFTPTDGEEVVGLGRSHFGKSVQEFTGELLLVPMDFDNVDHSKIIHYFEAYLKTSGDIVFGREFSGIEVEFSMYQDFTKDSRASFGVIGNGFQKGLQA